MADKGGRSAKNLYYFWLPGFIGILIVGALIRFNLTAAIPFVKNLFDNKSKPSEFFAATVMATAVWALTALVFRRLRTRRELKIINSVKRNLPRFQPGSDLDAQLTYQIGPVYTTSMLRQRFLLLEDRLDQPRSFDRAEALMAGQSTVDFAQSQMAFGPLRALIWALPALGFMGTALEMAKAVGGLGVVMGTEGYEKLRNLLVTEVLPHLAGAFDITLFALGSSVLCFLFLSLVVAHEEHLLNEADAVSLNILARLTGDGDSGYGTYTLVSEVRALVTQLELLNHSISQLNESGVFNQLGPRLHSIDSQVASLGTTLLAVKANLEQDRIIVSRPTGRGLIEGGRL